AYVVHSRRAPNPILDLDMLKIPTFRASNVAGSVFRIGIGATPFLLPLLLQISFGYDPFQAGLVAFAASLGSLGMRVLTVRFVRLLGFRSLFVWGAVVVGLLIAAPALFRPDTPFAVMFL